MIDALELLAARQFRHGRHEARVGGLLCNKSFQMSVAAPLALPTVGNPTAGLRGGGLALGSLSNPYIRQQ